MGGYGAFFFGIRCEVPQIVCCGVELQLMTAGSNSELILNQLQKRSLIEIPSLVEEASSYSGKLHLYWGDHAYYDYHCAYQLPKSPNIQISTLRSMGHPLPAYIHQQYGIKHFIEHHFTSDKSFPFQAHELSSSSLQLKHSPKLHQLTYLGNSLSDRELNNISEQEISLLTSAHIKAQYFTALGNAYTKKCLPHQAISYYIQAQSLFNSYFLAQSYHKLGQYSDALETLEQNHFSQELFEKHRQAAELHINCYIHINGFKALSELLTGPFATESHIYKQELQKPKEGYRARASARQLERTKLHIDYTQFKVIPNQGFQVSGVVFHPDEPSLQVESKDNSLTILESELGMPSPKFSTLHPQRQHAQLSRFKLILSADYIGCNEVAFRSSLGEELATIEIQIH